MGGKFVDITGQRFGKLVVLGLDGERCNRTRWKCQCECGTDVSVLNFALKRGTTTTCGSGHRAGVPNPKNVKHGGVGSRAYAAWCGIRQRCENAKDDAFSRYGGRGIKLCEHWRQFEKFRDDMGECPEGMEIDRIDVNGHYEPGNCRWVDLFEQANNKRNNRMVLDEGCVETVAEYARRQGLLYSTAYYRKVIRGNAPSRNVATRAPHLIWETEE